MEIHIKLVIFISQEWIDPTGDFPLHAYHSKNILLFLLEILI